MANLINTIEELKQQINKLHITNETNILNTIKKTVVEQLSTNNNATTENKTIIDILKQNTLLTINDFDMSDENIVKLPYITLKMLINDFKYTPSQTFLHKIFSKDYMFPSGKCDNELLLVETFVKLNPTDKFECNNFNNLDFYFTFIDKSDSYITCSFDSHSFITEGIKTENYCLIEKILLKINTFGIIKFFFEELIKQNKINDLNKKATNIKRIYLHFFQKIIISKLPEIKLDSEINYCEIIKCLFDPSEIFCSDHLNAHEVNKIILLCVSDKEYYGNIIRNLISRSQTKSFEDSFSILVDFLAINTTNTIYFFKDESSAEIILNKLYLTHLAHMKPYMKPYPVIHNKIVIKQIGFK